MLHLYHIIHVFSSHSFEYEARIMGRGSLPLVLVTDVTADIESF